MSNYILGIDIGGTTAKLGLFSEEHFPEIIVKRSVKTRPDDGGKYILPDIAEGIKQLFEDEGIDKSQIDGIGVGVPGPVIIGDRPGQTLVNKCVNLGWGVKDVASELSELTGIEKVVVENDANAAALGEIICGSVRDMAEKIGTYRKVTEVLVTIGTGIGGGIVRDGQIIRGYFGCAGEIGHIKIAPQHPLLAKLREAGADINTFDDFEYFASATEEIDRVLLRLEETYERDDEYFFEVGLLGRLLLSAVIEGDRNDTISFVKQIPALPLYGDMRPIWRGKLEVLEKKLETFPSDSAVAEARKEISNQCKRFAKEPKGIYRLNVPTGGGKTLSSLRYALAHAEQYNQKKLIFTSPLLSILEQNAAVIRNYVGNDDLILEHHSNVVLTEPSREQLDERELMVQNWDAPIIITTLVQLLNCLFDGKTTSIRRFQALCNSVIVIDEVQTVPTKLLSLFNLAIRFLAEQCGSTVILCSATQPYLEGVEHPLLPAPKSIVPFDPAIWNAFVRTQMLPLKNRRLEELPELILTLMQDTESLLVVCNKKSEAAYLLEQTRSSAFVSYHLSASMCMQHRRDAVAAKCSAFLPR